MPNVHDSLTCMRRSELNIYANCLYYSSRRKLPCRIAQKERDAIIAMAGNLWLKCACTPSWSAPQVDQSLLFRSFSAPKWNPVVPSSRLFRKLWMYWGVRPVPPQHAGTYMGISLMQSISLVAQLRGMIVLRVSFVCAHRLAGDERPWNLDGAAKQDDGMLP